MVLARCVRGTLRAETRSNRHASTARSTARALRNLTHLCSGMRRDVHKVFRARGADPVSPMLGRRKLDPGLESAWLLKPVKVHNLT